MRGIWWHKIRERHGWRVYLHVGQFEFHWEISKGWRGGLIATAGYGGQEDFCEATFAIPYLFLHFAFDTPFRWHRLRPFDGKYGASMAKFGVKTHGWDVYLLFGRDDFGTYYGNRRGRFGWLKATWLNREVALFRGVWITGRDRSSKQVMDSREVEILVGRWTGDRYPARQEIVRYTWKNRFRTRTRVDYLWDIEGRGIPTDPHGKWGADYQETMGFGASARDGVEVERLVAEAPLALTKRVVELIKDWPIGLVPEDRKEHAA